jgi:hypothetical protein
MTHHEADHVTDHVADEGDLINYPANHVVAVVDTAKQVSVLVPDLTNNGFLDSEIHVHCGVDYANELDASTGRSGLAGIAIRIAEALGIENVEMEVKSRYEQAMRDGHYVVLVAAPTEERKERASEILAKHDAHTVTFHGRFTIEDIVPPEDETTTA